MKLFYEAILQLLLDLGTGYTGNYKSVTIKFLLKCLVTQILFCPQVYFYVGLKQIINFSFKMKTNIWM